MAMNSNLKAALIGASAALLIAVVPALMWLGALSHRVEQLEDGSWLDEQREKLREDLREELGGDIHTLIDAALSEGRYEYTTTARLKPAALIHHPTGREPVPLEIMVRGEVKNREEGSDLWVFVFSFDASRYFPADKRADLAASGAWASRIQVGDRYDYGKQFDLIVTQVSTEAVELIQAYHESQSLKGFDELPAGTVIVERMPVTREVQ